MTTKLVVIRTSGAEEEHDITCDRPSEMMEQISRLIGAALLDTVRLPDHQVMFVNDGGWETRTEQRGPVVTLVPTKPRLPVNEKATALYHSVCLPGETHQIVGDVAVVRYIES